MKPTVTSLGPTLIVAGIAMSHSDIKRVCINTIHNSISVLTRQGATITASIRGQTTEEVADEVVASERAYKAIQRLRRASNNTKSKP